MNRICRIIFGFAFVWVSMGVYGQEELKGVWMIETDLSSAIDPWRTIELSIETRGSEVYIEELVSTGRRKHVGSWKFNTRKKRNINHEDWWIGNRHIGAFYGDGGTIESAVEWLEVERCLLVDSRYRLESSQGGSQVREHVEYRVSTDGERLTRLTLRSTRDLPVVHVFKRKEM